MALVSYQRPPCGRPKKTKAEILELRNEICDTAMRLFLEGGHDGISMRNIARAMNSSTSKIYHNYGCKIDILRDLSSIVFTALFDQVDELVENKADPKAQLSAAANGYVGYWVANVPHFQLVFMIDGFAQHQLSEFVDHSGLAPRFKTFTRLIKKLSGNAMSDSALKLKIDFLIASLNGISHGLITGQHYEWSNTSDMVAIAVESVID